MENYVKLSHDLRLLGVCDAVERRVAEAAAQGLSHAEFLLLLLEDERIHRKNRVAKILETKAKFKNQASLEEWDMSYDRGLSKAQLRELSLLTFLYKKQNLLLLGPTGGGKTQLAVALGRRACAAGHKVQFNTVSFFLEEAMASKAAGKYMAWVKSCAQQDLLILDDFALRKYTHIEAHVLMDVLEKHDRRSCIVTSQVSPQGWLTLFDDPVIGEALVDRLTNPAQTLTLSGGSYRKKLGC